MKKHRVIILFIVTIMISCLAVLSISEYVPLRSENTLRTDATVATALSHTFQSEVLPVLLPHEHMTGDSMMDTSHHQYLITPPHTLIEDIIITGFDVELQNAPASILHHVNLFDLSQESHVCPTGHPRALLAVGEDQLHTNKLTFPESHGIHLASGTPLYVNAMVHNPAQPVGVGGRYENVSLTLTIHYELAVNSKRNPLEYYLLHLADTPCQGENFTFTVPPNTETFTRRQNQHAILKPGKVILPSDGTVIYSGAHLHGWEGGQEVSVYKNDALVETFSTRKSAESEFIWETDHGPTNLQLTAGDTISITSTYANPNDQQITGAMGMYGFYFAPNLTGGSD